MGMMYSKMPDAMVSASDPYRVVKGEVEQAISGCHKKHEEWKRLLNSTDATSPAFQRLHSELTSDLNQLASDLQEIADKAINRVEENRSRFDFISDEDLRNRKEFVRVSDDVLKAINGSVYSREAQQKMHRDELAFRMNRANAARVLEEERQATVRRNDDFVRSQQLEQQQVRNRQDNVMEELASSAHRLQEAAVAINVELKEQQKMLAELDCDIDREAEKLNFVMRRMGRLLNTDNNKHLYLIVVLTVLLVMLLFLLINF